MATADGSLIEAMVGVHSEHVGKKKMTTIFKFEVVVHTKDKNLTYSDGIFITSFIIHRDYENNVGDYMEVKLSVPLGTFIEDIYPYMENCEVTIRVVKQFTTTSGSAIKPVISVNRYKAVFLKDKNKSIPNNKIYTKNDLNQQLPSSVTLQLVDRAVEAIRIKTTGGNILIKEKGAKVVKAILSAEANNVTIEGKPAIDTITVYKEDSITEVNNLALPSFSRIIEIPDYVQEKSVGMYTTGLGCYIQRYMVEEGKYKTGIWVYPLYLPRKTTPGVLEVKLTALAVDSIRQAYPALIYKDGSYSGLCSKPKVQESQKETSVMSEGTGFRVADAKKFMDKPIVIHKNGPVFDRTKLNTEVIFKEREDGINFAVNKGVYYNNLTMASEVNKKIANYLTFDLPNFDHDTIRPLMNLTITSDAFGKQEDSGKTPSEKKKYQCNILQMRIEYTNNNRNPVFSLNSKYTELTGNATVRACYELAKN